MYIHILPTKNRKRGKSYACVNVEIFVISIPDLIKKKKAYSGNIIEEN
jgi:hypothetical protein